MYPRARVGKPSDMIKIQHARCEYKRILAHEGGMASRYKQSTYQSAHHHHPQTMPQTQVEGYGGISMSCYLRSCSQHVYYIVVHCTTRSTAFMCAFWAVYKCSEALYVDFRSILVGPERRSHRYKRKVDQQSARTWPPYRHDNPARTTLYYL